MLDRCSVVRCGLAFHRFARLHYMTSRRRLNKRLGKGRGQGLARITSSPTSKPGTGHGCLARPQARGRAAGPGTWLHVSGKDAYLYKAGGIRKTIQVTSASSAMPTYWIRTRGTGRRLRGQPQQPRSRMPGPATAVSLCARELVAHSEQVPGVARACSCSVAKTRMTCDTVMCGSSCCRRRKPEAKRAHPVSAS